MVKPVILVVEDEPAVRMAAAIALLDAGFDVLEAGDAARALTALATGVDLVFTDIVMPGGLDGVELARRVRANDPKLPIIITSGGGHGYLSGVLAEGARFIPKPYRLDDMVDAVREALGLR
jgi:CheY-like chemotaxis protein